MTPGDCIDGGAIRHGCGPKAVIAALTTIPTAVGCIPTTEFAVRVGREVGGWQGQGGGETTAAPLRRKRPVDTSLQVSFRGLRVVAVLALDA